MSTTMQLRALDPQTLRNPWPLYEQWRAAGPVAELPDLGGWVVCDVAAAQHVLRDIENWSSDAFEGPVDPRRARWLEELAEDLPGLEELLATPLQALLALDPPDHPRLRSVMTPWFSAANVRRLEPLVDSLVADALGDLVTGDPVEAVAAFATPLPLRFIATLLGLPRERWHHFAELAGAASTGNPHLEDKDALRERLRAEIELMRFFADAITGTASDLDVHGLLAGLRGALEERRLTLREATGLCREVLVAGAESTVHHLSSGLLLLAQNPQVLSDLRDGPHLLPAFVEEALRLEPPFPGFWRRARRPISLAGTRMPAGALLLVPFAALNRDPRQFPAPDKLDLLRSAPRRHLAFGHGVHFCLGAPLVRLQSLATFGALVTRVRAIELLVDPADLRPVPSIQDRGVLELPLRCVPRT